MAEAAGIPKSSNTPPKFDIPEGGNNGQPPVKIEGGTKIDTIDPNGKSAWTELSEVAGNIYNFVVNSLSNLTNWFYYGLSCVSKFFFPGISFEKKSEELRVKFNAGGTFEKIQVLSEVASLPYEVKLEELFQQLYGLLDQKVKDSLLGFYHHRQSGPWVMPKGGVETLAELKDYLKPYLKNFAKYNLDKAQSLQVKPEAYNKINALRYYQRAEPLADFEPEEISKQINDEYKKAIDALTPEIKNQIFCSQFYDESCSIDELLKNEINPAEFEKLGASEKSARRSNYFNRAENSVKVNGEVQKFFDDLKEYRTDLMRKSILDRAYFSDHELINKQLQKVIHCQKDQNEEGAKKSLGTLIWHNRFTIGRFLYDEFRTFHIAAKIQEDITSLDKSEKELKASQDFETKRWDFAKGLFLEGNQNPNAEQFFLENSGVEQYPNPTTEKEDFAIGLNFNKPENQGFNEFIRGEAADRFMIANWNTDAFKEATAKVLQEITQP